jgi:hypothetical protein
MVALFSTTMYEDSTLFIFLPGLVFLCVLKPSYWVLVGVKWYLIVFCLYIFWDRLFLDRQEWPWTCDRPASTSWVLGLQVCSTMPGLTVILFCISQMTDGWTSFHGLIWHCYISLEKCLSVSFAYCLSCLSFYCCTVRVVFWIRVPLMGVICKCFSHSIDYLSTALMNFLKEQLFFLFWWSLICLLSYLFFCCHI